MFIVNLMKQKIKAYIDRQIGLKFTEALLHEDFSKQLVPSSKPD